MKIKRRWGIRIIGNWGVAFLSPILGTSTAFQLGTDDPNVTILLSALISSLIVVGIVIFREASHYGDKTK